MRLLAAGQRPISNVVDASNYVMLELGKPIHTFDAAAVGAPDGRPDHRPPRPAGRALETLDHVDREPDPETLVIADADGPIGIAGVMGGAESEVVRGDDRRHRRSAIFDPVSIRRTAFRYGLRSEASLRFEKGQEFRLARIGADRTARLIAEWAGGDVARAPSTRARRAAAGARRVPAGTHQPPARHRPPRGAARPPRAGRHRDGAGAGGHAVVVRPGRCRSTSSRATARS